MIHSKTWMNIDNKMCKVKGASHKGPHIYIISFLYTIYMYMCIYMVDIIYIWTELLKGGWGYGNKG